MYAVARIELSHGLDEGKRMLKSFLVMDDAEPAAATLAADICRTTSQDSRACSMCSRRGMTELGDDVLVDFTWS